MSERMGIQTRLVLTICIVLPVIWIISVLTAGYSLYEEVNESNDTQMSQLARRLLTIPQTADGKAMFVLQLKQLVDDDDEEGEAKDKYMTFALWDNNDKLILADRGSYFLRFIPKQNGFYDTELPSRRKIKSLPENKNNYSFRQTSEYSNYENKTSMPEYAPLPPTDKKERKRKKRGKWRILYLKSPDGKLSVAVGQNMKVRYNMVWEMIATQVLPWAIALPLLLIILLWSVRKSLLPLKQLTNHLHSRRIEDDSKLSDNVPTEIQPLIHALNRMFDRIQEAIHREHRFTSDAAHELRSPLTALKVQSEVLALSDDEDEKEHALLNMQSSINRASHLIEQLLVMARLDPITQVQDSPINWEEVAEKVMRDVNIFAREKRIKLKQNILSGRLENVLPLKGNSLLIELMLRNLIDNAIRYSPENSEVLLEMSDSAISVIDHGCGILEELMPRIRERFFRPPGQTASGSGLGLSIVDRIAKLHNLRLILTNREEGGLIAKIIRC